MNGYFDHNATTPMFPEAIEAQTRASESHWHNPSSLYPDAGAAKRLLERERERLADMLGVDEPERIIFTSGATEANNIVCAHSAAAGGAAIISEIEHPSVIEPAKRAFGERLQLAKLDERGVVDLDALETQIAETKPALVSVMAANNETGVIQPWAEIRNLVNGEATFHCDAAQWLGKQPASGLGDCDWITGSAHKFGGPKGVGFLVIPEDLDSLVAGSIGGPQESGFRAGTENYPAISAMLTALTKARSLLSGTDAIANERDAFEKRVLESIPDSKICGGDAERLWNTSMLVMPAHSNVKWLTRLARHEFQISTGSACSSGKGNPSHVMMAMGLDFKEMGRVLRVSAGWETTEEDWTGLGDALEEVWTELKSGERKPAAAELSLLTPGG